MTDTRILFQHCYSYFSCYHFTMITRFDPITIIVFVRSLQVASTGLPAKSPGTRFVEYFLETLCLYAILSS